MKTITYTQTKEITKNKLEISYGDDTGSPREWSNLGYFIAIDRDYHSPDRNEELISIVRSTGDIAENCQEHMDLIKRYIEEDMQDEGKVLAIYPINKYEHSGVVYSLGRASGFDYSNNGFYIITEKSQKEVGSPEDRFEAIIKDELNIYNKYANGEVLQFCLYDEAGEVADSCGGFYDIEDIREYLPVEWKDEDLSEYIKN